MISELEFFWQRVRVADGCWEWSGKKTALGYPQMRTKYAHRFSWELHRGAIPDGIHVLHRCDNPPCVNPDHLFLGTHADNMRDMTRKGRNAATKLTREEVEEIRTRYAAGEANQYELAADYGVSQPMIGYIVRREWWTCE